MSIDMPSSSFVYVILNILITFIFDVVRLCECVLLAYRRRPLAATVRYCIYVKQLEFCRIRKQCGACEGDREREGRREKIDKQNLSPLLPFFDQIEPLIRKSKFTTENRKLTERIKWRATDSGCVCVYVPLRHLLINVPSIFISKICAPAFLLCSAEFSIDKFDIVVDAALRRSRHRNQNINIHIWFCASHYARVADWSTN